MKIFLQGFMVTFVALVILILLVFALHALFIYLKPRYIKAYHNPRFRRLFLFIVVPICILTLFTYVFLVRPATARHSCNARAVKDATEGGYEDQVRVYNIRYKICMRSKGFEI